MEHSYWYVLDHGPGLAAVGIIALDPTAGLLEVVARARWVVDFGKLLIHHGYTTMEAPLHKLVLVNI